MKSVLPIEIPKRAKICVKCEETFKPGMEYYSILVDESNASIKRQDFCLSCWGKNAEVPADVKSVWKAQVSYQKDEKHQFRNRDEKIFHLFKELLYQEEEQDKMEAYVLSLYLMRKKQLLQREELTQDEEVKILYEIASTEEMILVKRFELTQMQIGLIQLRIAEKLK